MVDRLLSGVALVATAGVAVAVIVRLRSPLWAGIVAAQPGWLQVVEMVALFLGTNYWVHRASHEIPFLWRFHSVHHSSEQMDWLASARLHPVDTVMNTGTGVVVLAAAGFDVTSMRLAAGVTTMLTVAALLSHSNIRIRLPFLRWLIPNPEWHHWHHAAEAEAVNRNFSQFPWIDVALGTAYMPDRRPDVYGVTDPVPAGYLAQMRYPFARRSRPAPAPGRPAPLR